MITKRQEAQRQALKQQQENERFAKLSTRDRAKIFLQITQVLMVDPEGKKTVAEVYGISEEHVKSIQLEGLSNNWSKVDINSIVEPAPTPLPASKQQKDTTSPSVQQAQSGCRTKGGYFGAISEELLDKTVKLAVQDDMEALQKLVNTGLVFQMKEGIAVDIDSSKGLGKIKIRPVGSLDLVWTVREAVTCN